MITLTREEAQQVLDCLAFSSINLADEMTKTLRARLAQPEPKPVAWLYRGDGMVQVLIKRNDHFFSLDEGENFIKGEPLYTTPPQRVYCSCGDGIVPDDGALCGTCVSLKKMREWQGLTAYEIQELHLANPDWRNFACAIEAKLKEKNG